MRRLMSVSMVIVLMISGSVLIMDSNAEAISEPSATNKEWTIMVYLDGDNNLEYQGVNDFLEMAEVGSDSNINIVVQMDRIDWWDHYYHYYLDLGYTSSEASAYANSVDDSRYGDWDTCKRFYVEEDDTPIASNAISDLGEVDMGDPDNLFTFINWTRINYPADRYALILWDHGDQWNGVCSDDTSSGSILNMSELDEVFYNHTFINDFHMDIIGFDACLMGSIEVAYQMWGYADYMVASELIEPGQGWIYNWSIGALASDPTMSTEEFCKIIVDDYVESYETLYSAYSNDVTLSVTNLTADFYSGIYSIFNYTYELYMNYSLYQNYLNYAWGVRENYSENYCDMMDLFYTTTLETDRPYLTELFNSMAENLTGIYCYQNISDGDNDGYPYWATGLSIYFPEYPSWSNDYITDPYFYFPQNLFWPEVIWSAYQQPINTDPVISVNNPIQSSVSIFETQTIEFNVSSTDTEGNYINYYWFIDDEFVWSGHNLTIISDFGDSGSYVVDCIAFDGAWPAIQYGMTGFDIQSWDLDILVDQEKPRLSLPQDRITQPDLSKWNEFVVYVHENVEIAEVNVLTDFLDDDGQYNLSMEQVNETMFRFMFHPDDGFPQQSSDPGWHNITFTACDTAGNWAILDDVPYYLNDLFDPVIDIENEITVDQHQVVNFDGSECSDNWKIVNYTWSFVYDGEDIELYGANPQFLFDTAGTYEVNLTVIDPDGNSANDLIDVIVNDIDLPAIQFEDEIEIDQFVKVKFDGSSCTDNVGIVNWTWSIEYDEHLTDLYGEITYYTFQDAGTYEVTLIIKDDAGNSASQKIIVNVTDITDPEIILEDKITIDQGVGYAFSDHESNDNVGIVNWTWNFVYDAVEINLYGENPEYQFDIPGWYEISLTVIDEEGNSATGDQIIEVIDIEAPVANITFDQQSPYPGMVTFDGSSSSDNVEIISFDWKILKEGVEITTLDGHSTGFNFEDPGLYEILLVVTDEKGNSDEMTINVLIIEEPVEPAADDDDDPVDDDDDPVDDDDDLPGDDDDTDDDTPDDDTDDDDDTSGDDDSDKGSNIGLIIAIIIVTLVIVIAATVVIILVKRKENDNDEEEVQDQSEQGLN